MDVIGADSFEIDLQNHEFLLKNGREAIHPIHRPVPLNYKNILLKDINLQSRDLSWASFTDCVFENCNFTDCDFIDGRFWECEFINSNFDGCYYHDASISGCFGQKVSFKNCSFRKGSMHTISMVGVILDGSDFGYGEIVDSDIRQASLANVVFDHTTITNCKMYNDKKFKLGDVERAKVENIDISPNADGSSVISGHDLFRYLSEG